MSGRPSSNVRLRSRSDGNARSTRRVAAFLVCLVAGVLFLLSVQRSSFWRHEKALTTTPVDWTTSTVVKPVIVSVREEAVKEVGVVGKKVDEKDGEKEEGNAKESVEEVEEKEEEGVGAHFEGVGVSEEGGAGSNEEEAMEEETMGGDDGVLQVNLKSFPVSLGET